MKMREKLLLLVLILSLGYLMYMLITGLTLYKSYDADSKNTGEIIMDECELTTLFVVTVGEGYGGRIYDCAEK